MIRPKTVALAGVLALGLSASALAQDTGQSENEAKYEEKVAESWFTDNGFTDDYDKARRAYERVLFIVAVSKREPPGPDRELLELGQEAGAALAKLRRK